MGASHNSALKRNAVTFPHRGEKTVNSCPNISDVLQCQGNPIDLLNVFLHALEMTIDPVHEEFNKSLIVVEL